MFGLTRVGQLYMSKQILEQTEMRRIQGTHQSSYTSSNLYIFKRIQLSFVLNKMTDGWITRHAQTLTRGHSFLKIPQPVLTFLFCPNKLINFSSIFVIIPVLRTEAASSRVQSSTCFLVHVQKRAHLDLSFSWSVNSVGVLTYLFLYRYLVGVLTYLLQDFSWSVNSSSCTGTGV